MTSIPCSNHKQQFYLPKESLLSRWAETPLQKKKEKNLHFWSFFFFLVVFSHTLTALPLILDAIITPWLRGGWVDITVEVNGRVMGGVGGGLRVGWQCGCRSRKRARERRRQPCMWSEQELVRRPHRGRRGGGEKRACWQHGH